MTTDFLAREVAHLALQMDPRLGAVRVLFGRPIDEGHKVSLAKRPLVLDVTVDLPDDWQQMPRESLIRGWLQPAVSDAFGVEV